MEVILITRTNSEKIKDLKAEDGLKDLITEANSSGIKDIFIVSKVKTPKTKLFGIDVQLIYDEHPTGPTSMNTLFNKLKNKPDAFIVCSKEVGLRKINIENLISEIDQDNKVLVAGYKFMIKIKKLNDEIQGFYENENLIAYKVPWNTCAIWNHDLFKKYVGKFDEITARNLFGQIGVTVDGEGFQTDHKGMEDGLAIAKASSQEDMPKIYFKLLDDYLFWEIKKDDESTKKHREKLARKDVVMRNFMAVRNYSVEDLKAAEMEN